MTEHEQLKWMSDLIGYELDGKYPLIEEWTEGGDFLREVNVREIIFTNTFQRKLVKYLGSKDKLRKKIEESGMSFDELMMDNLDNPTQYLYNLLTK